MGKTGAARRERKNNNKGRLNRENSLVGGGSLTRLICYFESLGYGYALAGRISLAFEEQILEADCLRLECHGVL